MGAWWCSGPPRAMSSRAGSIGVPVSLLRARKRGQGLPSHVLSGLSHTSHVSLVFWGGRLLSSQYDYLGDRRPVPVGMYPYHYPASPTVHDKMVRMLLALRGGAPVDWGAQSPPGRWASQRGGSLLGQPRREPLQGHLFGSELGCSGTGQDRKFFYWCLWSLPKEILVERLPVPALQAPGLRGSRMPLDPCTPCNAGPGSSPPGRSPARTGLRLAQTLHLFTLLLPHFWLRLLLSPAWCFPSEPAG